jgi:hypothetical protein
MISEEVKAKTTISGSLKRERAVKNIEESTGATIKGKARKELSQKIEKSL